MAFPGQNYAPPSVYTRTLFENPFTGSIDSLKIPVFIGEGNEYLIQRNLELVRGSSASIDQRRVNEDMTGRAVVSVSATNVVTLGAWNGVLTKLQVANLPIVTGDGTGSVSTNRSDVSVTIGGLPIVVLSVDGTNGLVELAQAPKTGDVVKVTYFFNRTDTLITDDVSDQVTATPAFVQATSGLSDVNAPDNQGDTISIHADILDPVSGAVSVPNNNVLNLIIDGVAKTIVIPANTAYTMIQAANALAGQAGTTSLTAGTFVNNYGQSALQLNATQDITVLAGSANALLGLVANTTSVRAKTFYTFQGPIVDGTNGGVTTTDPSHVTVKVGGVQVIPTAVNGASRAVTLPVAPAVGATVTIRYYFNSWQDTFDYLQHDGVTSVASVGSVPDSGDFTADADYILKDSKILWGTAWTVEADETSAGAELFDDTQISGTLIDNRTYLSPATSVVTTSGGVSSASQRDFLLAFPPTLGNGRDTPLGSSLFQNVANGRIDVPVNRPDVVTAYWGYGVQDAIDRGPITVLKVEGSVITLDEDVPVGATCFATFYYNRLTDETYTLTNKLAGASGTGTYEIAKNDGSSVIGASFNTASKGAGLTGITIVFPSGSELTPDLRHESVSGAQFTGPVEETVTVNFATKEATPAKWASPGAGTYAFVTGQSDRVALTIDSTAVDPDGAGGGAAAAGIPLTNPTSFGGGFFATLIGEEIDYTAQAAGLAVNDAVVGESFAIATAEDMVLFIDGVQVDVTIPATNFAAAVGQRRTHAGDIVEAINTAAKGTTPVGGATAGGVQTIDISALGIPNDTTAGHYVGWRVTLGATGGAATAGQTGTVATHSAAGLLTMSAVWAGGAVAAADEFRLYNPDSMGQMKSATRFAGATIISAGDLDTIRFEYRGDGAGTFASGDCVITPGTYASATALATAVQTAMNGLQGFDVGTAWAGPGVGFQGAQVEVTADGDGRLVVKLQLAGQDNAASFRFITPVAAVTARFQHLAGFDAGTVGGTDGAVLIEAEVARFLPALAIPAVGTQHLNDRIMLRNRLLPGGNATSSMTAHDIVGQMELRIGAGSGNTKAGFAVGASGEGGFQATIRPASMASYIGTGGGQDAVTGEPQVTFFDGTGATAANNVFAFTVDGVAVEVTFTATPGGTATDIGPASGTANGSVCDQILDAVALVGGAPFGNAAAAFAAGLVVSEGAGIRITSQTSLTTSAVVIGTGSANATLRYTSGSVGGRSLVSAKLLASALNGGREDSFTNYLIDPTLSQGGGTPMFNSLAYATVVEDAAGKDYLFLQSLTTGVASVITIVDPTQGGIVTDSWLFPGTGINAVALDGAVGEAGLSGFFVASNKAAGSGSNNDSVLNDGVGSDGTVGQTYRDPVTGLSFTVLPRGFHDNPTGPWQAYPTGGTATFRLDVSNTHTTNSNLPVTSIPGLELKVANTLSIGVDDTAEVQTFERGGEEPTVGDVYYATYVYTKESFNTAYFTKMASIEQAYGSISSDNPVTLAAFLCSLNGAVLMGIKQVPKASGSNLASLTDYKAAITSLEGVQPGQINPDIIIPLRGDSTDLYSILKKSNEIQSSIRYKSERTSIVGMSSGSDPKAVQALAQTLGSDRMRVVYPDTAIIRLTDAFNKTTEEVVDGTMLAAALAGSVVSPNVDVATPWTGKNLVGFVQLGRLLDAVEMNQTAQRGVTVIEERPPFMRVRHGLTTDMSNILRKTPTVRMIADEVQRQSRNTLANFIGVKFLPGILSQVEGRLAMMLKALVTQQIIAAYSGVKAVVSADDPTVAEVEAFYQPVFPLLYIVLTFHLRASL